METKAPGKSEEVCQLVPSLQDDWEAPGQIPFKMVVKATAQKLSQSMYESLLVNDQWQSL